MLVDLNNNIKILDFGLSNYFQPDETLKTFCGSLYFAAPELLMGKPYVGPEVDVWALGVVLYVMVCGKVPFDDKSLPALHEKIKRCDIQYPAHLSQECRNLLEMMINPDGQKRASLTDIIDHPWLNLGCNFSVRSFCNERVPMGSVDPNIKRFMLEEFRTQYSPQQIEEVLEGACRDWGRVKNHPLVSLYFLVRDKMVRDGILMLPVNRPLGTRSPSCPDLVPPPGLTQKNDVSESRRTRNLAVTVGGTGAVDRTPLRPGTANSLAGSRARSSSLSGQPNQFTRSLDDYDIKTVYLKGLFSTGSTTKRDPNQLREDIATVLRKDAITFENHGAIFMCEYHASVTEDPIVALSASVGPEVKASRLAFEMSIVKQAVFGQYGVLFKRVQGDISLYKNLCSQILAQLDL